MQDNSNCESKWISVKEKLPDENQWIIYHAPDIFDPSTSAQMWVGQYDPEDRVFFSNRGFFGGGEVTHWMPVPELPVIDKKDRNGSTF